MRMATADEVKHWDEMVAANPDGGSVLQCRAFAETKAKYGWRPVYAVYEPSGALSEQVAVCYHVRAIPALGELWYAPKGPGVSSIDQLEAVLRATKQNSGPFVVKVDPELPLSGVNIDRLLHAGLVPSRDIQLNSSTILVDLAPSEEEILASFKQKTRYNVRLAAKKGVQVSPVELTTGTIEKMYGLMKETYDRAGIYTRSKAYFEAFWKLHSKQGRGQLFFAYLGDQVLAGAYVTYLGKKALYKDGASTREHREVQAPYLLQWEVMRWLKGKGVEQYDLHGVPPKARIDDSTHRLYPLVQFKTGFNLEVTEFIGTYDLVLDQAKYRLWSKFGERAVMTWSYRAKKELFY